MKKAILLALVLMSSLLVAALPACAPGPAQKPTWNVGDSWSMGKTIDLSQYNNEIQNSMDEMGYSGSVDLRGGAGAYMTMKVTDDDVQVDDYTCYKLTIKGAFGANIKADFSLSMQYMGMQSMSMSGWVTAVADVWIDGYAYYTVEDLAEKKVSLVLKAEFTAEGYIDMSAMGMSQSMSFLFEGKNIRMEIEIENDPPVDTYQFPIEDGEIWSVPETNTTVNTTISSQGTVRTKLTGGGLSIDDTTNLKDLGTMEESVTIETGAYNMSADAVGEEYHVKMDLEDLLGDFSGYEYGLPIDELSFPLDIVMVYDPQEGYFTSTGIMMDGELTTFAEPTTEDKVNTFYADPSANVPGPGMDLWMILLIIVIIAVVVIAVVAAIAVRRRKKRKAAEAQPGAPTEQMASPTSTIEERPPPPPR